jgi:hypothetical protein
MAYEERFKRRAIQYKDSGHTFAGVYMGLLALDRKVIMRGK